LYLKHIKLELLETTQKLDYVSSHVEHLYDKSFYTKQSSYDRIKIEKEIIPENYPIKEYILNDTKEEVIEDDKKEDDKKEEVIEHVIEECKEGVKQYKKEIEEEIEEKIDIIETVIEDIKDIVEDTVDNAEEPKEEVKPELVKSVFKIGNKSTKRKK
jgi:hypothetical protein